MPSPHSAASGSKVGLRRKLKGFFLLTKPQVIELLLVTTAPTMIFAAGEIPNLWLILNTMLGGAMAAGGAGAFNCYIDREADRLMKRTEKRPLVTGEVTDREGLVFAWILSIVAVAYLTMFVNPLSGVLGLAAILLYVVFYSLILKRRTAQNIVWGGIAGCMPVFIGWAAVENRLSFSALVLFVLIFLWTPPHYWPLSMKYAEDYQRAGIPMLGAIASAKAVSVQVVLYAWATVICSLMLIPVGGAGWVYGLTALIAGAWFIWKCHHLHQLALAEEATSRTAMVVFHASITYLTVVFVALAIDPFVGGSVL
ncbi:heme o synthase [uncultured Kocuria sp.]|uniref:heme o synthase n=1 Tax=uncultured Kocuria sp. TaxID=259305 RepID=UPI002595F4BB|nr:heme o synthase [uncultured Kocuria sp.]MCT1368499.1 heme o synthase [Rothia sp. p3-SID1597]